MSAMPELSETERVQQQTTEEWLAEYEGTSDISKPAPVKIIDHPPKATTHKQSVFLESLKNAGIVSIRFVGEKLLITTDRHITAELDVKIKNNIQRLVKIAKPDTGELLYEYMEYRTSMNKYAYIAMAFKELRTDALAERYFNICLKKKNGENFKTGINGMFRVVGNIKRLQEGMFLKFWMDTVKQIPNDRPSQICRYMNSKLSGVVVSCPNPAPYHDFTKLITLKYEGHLYQIT